MRNTRDPLLDVFDAPESCDRPTERDDDAEPGVANDERRVLAPARAGDGGALEKQNLAMMKRLSRPHIVSRLDANRNRQNAGRAAFLARASGARRYATAPASRNAFESEKMPYREGRAALMQPNGMQNKFEVPNSGSLVARQIHRGGVRPSEIGLRRRLGAHDRGDAGCKENSPGWSLGVTGRKSKNRPQTLVLQLAGEPMEGSTGVEAVFSGPNIELNRPYFVAVSVDLANTSEGGITFYSRTSRTMTNHSRSRTWHAAAQPIRAAANFTIGGRTRASITFGTV